MDETGSVSSPVALISVSGVEVRIAWLGHLIRLDDKRTPKRILEGKPIGTRIRGRPRKRWMVDTEEDMQIMKIRRWRKRCEERAEWKRITGKAKTHSGL